MSKVKIYLVGSVALLLSLIIGGYFYITGTPEYALKQAVESYKDKNKVAFENHVNLDNILNLLVDDVLNTVLQENVSSKTDGMEALGTALGMKMIESFKPQIKNMAKAELFKHFDENTKKVVTNDKENLMKNFKGADNIMKSINSSKIELINLGDTTISGNTSLIPINLKHKIFKKDLIIEIQLSKESGHWKINEVRNVGKAIVNLQKWEAAYLEEINKPIIEEMNKSIIISKFKKKNRSDSWGIKKSSSITLGIKNVASKTIESSSGTIQFKNSNGIVLKEMPFNIKNPLVANDVYGGTVKVDINSFIQSENNFYKTKNLKAELKIEKVTFKNGKTLELVEKVLNRTVANAK